MNIVTLKFGGMSSFGKEQNQICCFCHFSLKTNKSTYEHPNASFVRGLSPKFRKQKPVKSLFRKIK